MLRLLFMAAVALLPVLLVLPSAPLSAAGGDDAPHCQLALSFDVLHRPGILEAAATITIPPGQRLTLTLPDLQVSSGTLSDDQGRKSYLPDLGNVLILPPAERRRYLELVYSKRFHDHPDNLISGNGIVLVSNWHPRADKPMLFSLSADLPPEFTAISEADAFPLKRIGNTVSGRFSQPVSAIHFVAGPYEVKKLQVHEDLTLYSLFFAEDADLAEDYLRHGAEYLRRYEQDLGPYPYRHYAIVANRLPSGLGIPTFSLFGRTVLRLPFIKTTSLGHEIVHAWFGNGVEVDAHGGNWCEGLTAFLSDHRYREERGEGVADRHETINRYLSYVGSDVAIPLGAFISADHHQNLAEAKRAVGYHRGALLFHELREKIGRPAFSMALRQFAHDFRFKKASWHDLEQSFTAAAGIDLAPWFTERLTRTEIPDLLVSGTVLTATASGWQLSFTLEQRSSAPFSLLVPLTIESPGREITVTKEIHEAITPVTIHLDKRPTALTIDSEYSFLRKLTTEETVPTWSRFLGGSKRLAILDSEAHRQRYRPLLDALGDNLTVTTGGEVSNSQLGQGHLIFLGTDQPAARSLFGPPANSSAGLTLDVRRNPLSPDHVAVLLDVGSDDKDRAVLDRLGHYGKYSFLAFNGGVNLDKSIRPAQQGIRVEFEQFPAGGATTGLSSFTETLARLADARVIYLGETHTNYGDHLLQLRVIEALYRRDPQLVIGMEMFPAAVQASLDRYLLANDGMSERDFLQASRYFQVWRYDWRLYRDLVTFAKEHKIRILGLNLEQGIVSTVFREGGTDGLDRAVLSSLPVDRDLDLPGYAERLRQTHGMHQSGRLGQGSAAGFLQAQALWDETMAEHIAEFIRNHPEHKLVVLAGKQHTRKDSGIPPRVARRVAVPQASVLNLSDGPPLEPLDKIADFYFLSAQAFLPEAAKIGVTLESASHNGEPRQKITAISPHGKAAAAGLAMGDILLTVNDSAILDLSDVQLALLEARPGDTAVVGISRRGESGESEHSLAVQLTGTPTLPTHP
jgi:uncharacterized iron-regulated protein